MYIFITIVLTGLGFLLGTKWKQENIASKSTYHLTSDINVQVSPDDIGTLPKGTTLYEFKSMGETTTYVVFVNIENQTILRPFQHEHKNTVDPLDGYTNL